MFKRSGAVVFYLVTGVCDDNVQEQHRDIQMQIEEVRTELALRRFRAAESDGSSPPMILKACEWGENELNLFSVLSSSGEFAAARVEARRRAAAAQDAPDQEFIKTLLAEPLFKAPKSPEPAWLSAVAHQRKHFRNCVFLIDRRNGQIDSLKFVFAVRSPLYAAFSNITAKNMWVTLGVVCGDNLEALASEHCIAFEAEFVSHIPSARLAEIDISQIEVLSHLEYTKGCEMRAWAVRPEPLRKFLASLPPKKERDSARTRPRAATASRAAMDELPAWARDRLNKSATNRPAPDSQIAEPSEGSDQDEKQPFDEDQVEALFEELELRRADYGAAEHPRHEDCRVVLFATKQGMGLSMAIQAYEGICSGDHAVEFCRRRSVNQNSHFHLSVYTEDVCGVLARSWCHRMQYFLNLTLSEDSDYKF
ncbi:unnamed protein product [Polarella glacialis]|uniref:Uncharacterized protein n=1 Tax=Polarella glacialis TaxID=89957 RepID=A0A813DTK0_POLGL|nr:unnamed protein product [Polarella glacialis]